MSDLLKALLVLAGIVYAALLFHYFYILGRWARELRKLQQDLLKLTSDLRQTFGLEDETRRSMELDEPDHRGTR